MAEKHFYEQEEYTNDYLVSYFEKHIPSFQNKNIKLLEIGCAEGGTLSSLSKMEYHIDGLELETDRAEIAKKNLPASVQVIVGDITNRKIITTLDKKYDIIIMRDVIEHIEKKEEAIENVLRLLNPEGILFLTFPLKFSPYAGHQQNFKTLLRFYIYITLFPSFLIKLICNIFNEKNRIAGLLYLKKCALSYRMLKKLISKKGTIFNVDFFISRPVFKQRFGWPIIKMVNIPVLREFAMGCELLIKKNIK